MLSRSRGNSEFLVIVIEPVFSNTDLLRASETGANRGARTVGGDGGCERCFVLGAVLAALESQDVALRYGRRAHLLESHLYRVMARGFFYKHAVERGAADGVDDLVLSLPVGVESGRAGRVMDHPASHRYEERANTVHNTGALQCTNSPCGER